MVTELGFDPIWYGVFMVIMVEQGMITPPIGLNVFVLKGMAGDIPLYTIFRGVIPYFIAMLVGVAILAMFPESATFLPSTM